MASVLAKKERKKIVFPTKKELAEAMAEYTATLSVKFCQERGYFTVVLSGGDLISWLRYVWENPTILFICLDSMENYNPI